MKLENQVISLDLAKRLKELGVKQESYFIWAEYNDEDDERVVELLTSPGSYSATFTSAFTCSELGEMLPTMFNTYKTQSKGWTCFASQKMKEKFHADTEADARAALLCYLLQNRLIN